MMDLLLTRRGEDLGSLEFIPASNNSVSEHLSNDFNTPQEYTGRILLFQSRIDHVEERTDQFERQMEEVTHAYNKLIDSHSGHAEEIQYLKAKVANLKNRSRRSNIKFRGIPETVKNSDLVPFIQQLFLKMIPSLSPFDLLIN